MKHLLPIMSLAWVLVVATGVSAEENEGDGAAETKEKTNHPTMPGETEGEASGATASEGSGEPKASPPAESGTEADGEAAEDGSTDRSASGEAEKGGEKDATGRWTIVKKEGDAPEPLQEAATPSTAKAEATSDEAGPPPAPAPRFALQPDPPYTAYSLAQYNEAYEKNRRFQVMGKAMLAASFVMELAGAIVIEATEMGPGAWAGFAVVGTGIAHFIASAFMLGLSKPVHHLTPPRRDVALETGAGDIIF